MRINNQNFNQNFNGYKNIWAGKCEDKKNSIEILAMQLDNNGTRDLDTLREIEFKVFGMPRYKNDLLILKTGYTNSSSRFLIFNDFTLDTKKMNPADKNNEKTYLKAFSLVAKLTSKIQDFNNPIIEDNNYPNILKTIKKELLFMIYSTNNSFFYQNDPKNVEKAAFSVFDTKPSIDKMAKDINSHVMKTMIRYFK